MIIKELFSKLYNNSLQKENPIWENNIDPSSRELIRNISILFNAEIDLIFKNIKESEEISIVIHELFDEIIELKNNSGTKDNKDLFSYLQFVWGLLATSNFNVIGEFDYCYDIFMKSIFDVSYRKGEDHNPEVIYKILDSKNQFISQAYTDLEQWFSQLYYYSKSYSGLNEWCNLFFEDIYYELKEHLEIKPYHPQFLSNLFSWCAVCLNERGCKAIMNIIYREYCLINWSSNDNLNKIKLELGLQLLLSYDSRISDKLLLFKELKSNNLNVFARMQGVIALCNTIEQLEDNYDLLKEAISDFNKYLSDKGMNTISLIYQRARLFKNLLNTCIFSAIEEGKGDLIDDLLIAFYNVQVPQNTGTTVYFAPTFKKKVAFCFPSKNISYSINSQKILVDIVDIENKAFKTTKLITGGFNKKVEYYGEKIGIPDSNFAEKYEAKLLELYDFTKIEEELESVNSLIQFDFDSFPLQSLMIKTIKNTIPINLSLTKKEEFPKVKTVLFWSGNSITSEVEETALNEIFSSTGINFEIHKEGNSTLQQFISKINEIDPEIVWISSHAEFGYYEPNKSKIHLSEAETIDIRNFHYLINNGNNRRLLILNVCESGVHAGTGEFKNLGFPNLLVAKNQDIISHLWLAESRFAYVFGILLAIDIAYHGGNYFDAFKFSLSKVLTNKEAILNEINRIPFGLTELKTRIENDNSTKWGNLISTGSPVYYL